MSLPPFGAKSPILLRRFPLRQGDRGDCLTGKPLFGAPKEPDLRQLRLSSPGLLQLPKPKSPKGHDHFLASSGAAWRMLEIGTYKARSDLPSSNPGQSKWHYRNALRLLPDQNAKLGGMLVPLCGHKYFILNGLSHAQQATWNDRPSCRLSSVRSAWNGPKIENCLATDWKGIACYARTNWTFCSHQALGVRCISLSLDHLR